MPKTTLWFVTKFCWCVWPWSAGVNGNTGTFSWGNYSWGTETPTSNPTNNPSSPSISPTTAAPSAAPTGAPTETPIDSIPVRINCGLDEPLNLAGIIWQADRNYGEKSWARQLSEKPDTDVNDQLYQSWREYASPGFSYTFYLDEAGTYGLNLYFVETQATASGQRYFDIVINNETVESSFDILYEAGARDTQVLKEYNIDVVTGTNGYNTLEMTFIPGNSSNLFAKLDAFEIREAHTSEPSTSPTSPTSSAPTDTPTGTPTDTPTDIPSEGPTEGPTEGPREEPTGYPIVKVNTPIEVVKFTAGDVDVDVNGVTWQNDELFLTGNDKMLDNPTDCDNNPELHQQIRWMWKKNGFQYGFDFSSDGIGYGAGKYTFNFYFCETEKSAVGDRLLKVSINDVQVISNLDVFKEAGGDFKEYIHTLNVDMDDASAQSVSIDIRADTYRAMLSALEISWTGETEAPIIAPTQTPVIPVYDLLKINCGRDTSGVTWYTDSGYWTCGHDKTYSTDVSYFSSKASMYRYARWCWNSLTYEFSLYDDLGGYGVGVYQVNLYFAEVDSSGDFDSVEGRVMNIYINGKLRFENFDMYTEGGGLYGVVVKTFEVYVPPPYDSITIYLEGVGDARPSINGIEINYIDYAPTPTSAPSAAPTLPPTAWHEVEPFPLNAGEVIATAVDEYGYYLWGGHQADYEQTPLPNMYYYDKLLNTWTMLGTSDESVQAHHQTAQAYNGKIYSWGGSVDAYAGTMRVYDPANDSWTRISNLTVDGEMWSVLSPCSGLVDDVMYVAGGVIKSFKNTTNRAFAYNITSNSWREIASMPDGGRNHAGGIGVDGLFYVIGGRKGDNAPGVTYDNVFVYDVATDSWSERSPLLTATGGFAQPVHLDKKLIVCGGETCCAAITTVQEYDIDADTWHYIDAMNYGRHGTAAVQLQGVVYVAAGGLTLGAASSTYHEALPYATSAPSMSPTVPSFDPTATPTLEPTVPVASRMVCGEDGEVTIEDDDRNIWGSDATWLVGSAEVGIYGGAITNLDQENEAWKLDLFATYRVARSGDLEYFIYPLVNGLYAVTLGVAEPDSNADRTFGVEIEGESKLSGLDLAASYGELTVGWLTFTTEVVNNSMSIKLTREVGDPLVAAIEVKQSEGATGYLGSVYINSGFQGLDIVDLEGNQFVGDNYYYGCNGDSDDEEAALAEEALRTQTISTTASVDADSVEFGSYSIYQSARESLNEGGRVRYCIPENGLFYVYILLAEIDANVTQAGQRYLNVTVEDDSQQVDIITETGAQNTALELEFRNVPVVDGMLNVIVTGLAGKALINGLYVELSADHFAHSVITVDSVLYVAYEDLAEEGERLCVLDAGGSHTHFPSAQLALFEWSWAIDGVEYGRITETTDWTEAVIAVGTYDLTLVVTDTVGNENALTVTLDILPGAGYSGCVAYYYDYSHESDPLTEMPDFLTKAADEVLVEPDLNFAFGSAGSGSEGFGSSSYTTSFAAQYLCYFTLNSRHSGWFDFSLSSNDGARLYIDDDLVVENSGISGISGIQSDAALTTATAQVNLREGRRYVRVEYFCSSDANSCGLELSATDGDRDDYEFIYEYALAQKLSVLETIFPTEGTNKGGTTVTLSGIDFLWDPTGLDCNITIVDEFGIVLHANESYVSWDDSDTSRMTFLMPAHPYEAVDVRATVYVDTPAGRSNGMEFNYLADAYDAPVFGKTKILEGTLGVGYTAVAWGPDDKLYAANYDGTLFRGELQWYQNSKIYKLVPEDYLFTSDIVSETWPDWGHHTVLGLTFNPNDDPEGPDGEGPVLYLAYANIYHGKIIEDKYGWISKVWGANLDKIEHVAGNFPISDHDHSINQLVFHPNGILYVSNGGNTNGGVPGGISTTYLQTEKYYSACIIGINMYDPNFDGNITYDRNQWPTSFNNGVFIFSHGVRNGFGIMYHPRFDALYATDNGPNTGFGDESIDCETSGPEPVAIDKFLRLEHGHWYGHPNRMRAGMTGEERQCVYREWDPNNPVESDDEWTVPLGMYNSAILGIEHYWTNNFGGQYKDSIIMGELDERAYRVVLDEDDEDGWTLKQVVTLQEGGWWAHLADTVDPRGCVFHARYYQYDLRFIATDEDNSQYGSNLYVTSVHPYYGPKTGGRTVTIRGFNFGFKGTTTVLMGETFDTAVECQVLSRSTDVEFDVILCVTPNYVEANPDFAYGAVTVFVTTGGQDFILPRGYVMTTNDTATPRIDRSGWIDKVNFVMPSLSDYCVASTGTFGNESYIIFGGGQSGMWRFDVVQDDFIQLTDAQPYATGSGQVVEVYHGSIYVFGGDSILAGATNFECVSCMYRYDPQWQEWSQLSPKNSSAQGGQWHQASDLQIGNISHLLYAPISGVEDGKIYIAGGLTPNNAKIVDTLFVYDIETDTWSSSTDLPVVRFEGSGVAYDGKFYVFGGRVKYYGAPRDECYVYNIGTAQWSQCASLLVATARAGKAVVVAGKIVVVGGESSDEPLNVVQRYDPTTNTWELLGDMPTSRSGASPVVVDEYTIYVVAGEGTDAHEVMVFL